MKREKTRQMSRKYREANLEKVRARNRESKPRNGRGSNNSAITREPPVPRRPSECAYSTRTFRHSTAGPQRNAGDVQTWQ
jgi:hypothetical protein